MILMFPLMLAVLAMAFATPFVAAWAAYELGRRLRGSARAGLVVLAVAASLWWMAFPDYDFAVPGALLSWLAVAAATTAAVVQAVHRRATDPARLQRRIDAWYARHPVMPPAWYGQEPSGFRKP